MLVSHTLYNLLLKKASAHSFKRFYFDTIFKII